MKKKKLKLQLTSNGMERITKWKMDQQLTVKQNKCQQQSTNMLTTWNKLRENTKTKTIDQKTKTFIIS